MSMCKKIISVFLAVISVILMCCVGVTANAVEYASTDTGTLTVHLNVVYDTSKGVGPMYGMKSDGSYTGGTSSIKTYFPYGDVNMDGEINVLDSTLIGGYVRGNPNYNLTKQQLILADCDGDGEITSADATCIQCYIVKLMDEAGRCGQNSTVRVGRSYPVSGVTIGVYKIDNITSYLTKNGKPLPKAEDVTVSGDPFASATTDANGVATITDLPRAIYYCKITAVINGVVLTKTMTPFVFSVPSSNAEFQSTTATGWNYDLHAYPKVEINYGKVTLKKVDSTTKKGLPGATFTLYHSDDGKKTWSVLKENLKTGDNGMLTVDDLEIGDYKFVETATSDDSYILNSSVGYEFSMTTEGLKNCDYADGNDIIVSNDTVDIHKYVLDNVDESAATLAKFTNAVEGIDTTQSTSKNTYWSIHVTVPSDIKDLDTFDVIDWYDDKYFLLDSKYCVVSGVDANGNKSIISAANYATSIPTDMSEHPFTGMTNPPLVEPTALKWAFRPAKLSSYKEIVIYVPTTLQNAMPLATDVPNTATIDYTNVIGTDSTHRKQAETPTVHTGGVKILKLAAATGTPLKNVKFRIYATKEDALAGENYYRTATTNADGIAILQGIPYGEFSTNEVDKAKNGSKNGSSKYWVMEVAPPSGYLAMKEPIEVTVNANSHNTDTDNTITILNYKSPVLPNAGSITAIALAGTAFVFIGIGMFIIIKRKKRS